ncbi:membrane protein UL45 [Spheniscid alphaherpesvirus 1]|uniref:Membrane protein UL45 n=1 Tax=Spheniscid alphaherpesvirus 1 TaxID=2560777 RepID=A0A1R3T5D7_9ALPH|nr:membrane protein UL45 [Spheniscid alphaherpesvirus 1]SCO83511.1 membrane protein UL45 [Spheniscid alphaherpesvirus 1]
MMRPIPADEVSKELSNDNDRLDLRGSELVMMNDIQERSGGTSTTAAYVCASLLGIMSGIVVCAAVIFLVCAFAVNPDKWGKDDCQDGWIGAGKYCIRPANLGVTYEEAERACAGMGKGASLTDADTVRRMIDAAYGFGASSLGPVWLSGKQNSCVKVENGTPNEATCEGTAAAVCIREKPPSKIAGIFLMVKKFIGL